jgi:superfamily II DNA or RNA helicase
MGACDNPCCAVLIRPYQDAAERAVRAHWAAGRRRVCVVLPTSAGKTVVAELLLRGARRPLAVVHTDALRIQSERRLPGVRVATVQALVRRGLPIDADVVFLDECHHLAAGTWRQLLALLPRGACVVGCTATPERADGAPLAGLFDAMVCTVSYSQLLAGGWLAPVRVVPCTGMDPVVAYLSHGQRRPGILFAPTLAQCHDAVARLGPAGVRAATLDSTTPAAQRARLVASYDTGELDMLASPMALAEGFDSPRAAVCVLARSCAHVGTYLQTANRISRPHPSKTAAAPALLLDCTGAAERHGHPTADRVYSLQGRPIRPVVPASASQRAPSALPRRPAPQAVQAVARAAGGWWRRAVAWWGG